LTARVNPTIHAAACEDILQLKGDPLEYSDCAPILLIYPDVAQF